MTDNLDDTDKERYDVVLRNLDKNQISVQSQVQQEYSLTSSIFTKNKENERSIESNERILKDKLALVTKSMANNSTSDNTHFHTIETIYYILGYSLTFLHLLTEIENSIQFCASGTLHPSVISIDDIHAEIKTVRQYQNASTLGNVTQLSFSELTKFLKVACAKTSNKIVYYISIPINYETNFALFHLLSMPSLVGSHDYVSVLPEVRHVLQGTEVALAVTSQCPKLGAFHVEVLPETNQFLLCFPTSQNLIFTCNGFVEKWSLQGIFLFGSNYCTITFDNPVLKVQLNTTGELELADFALTNVSHVNLLVFNFTLAHFNLDYPGF